MSDTAVVEAAAAPAAQDTTQAAAPAAAPSPTASAPASAPAAAAPAASAPAAAPTPDPAEWRARAVSQVFGEEKPDDVPETKAEREKLAKLAARYNTPGDALKALREAQVKISSGELKRALPKDAKPEQVAEWRKENGIPEAPDKYDMGLPKDFTATEFDKVMLDGWAAKAHALNASPDVVKAGTAAFLETRAAIAAQLEATNKAAEAETIETLRAEFGSDYKPNIDGVDSLLRHAGTDVVAAIHDARDSSGVRLLNNPEVLRWLSGHARELGFVGATVVPSGGDLGKGIDEEIEAIGKSMFLDNGAKNPAYWKSDKAIERYSKLLEARDRKAK